MGGLCGKNEKYYVKFQQELYAFLPECYIIACIAPRTWQKRLAKYLVRMGFTILCFNTSAECINEYTINEQQGLKHPDLIVYHTETEDHFGDKEILNFIRQHKHIALTPLIRIANGAKKGWDDFVYIPPNLQVLNLKIRSLLADVASHQNGILMLQQLEKYLTIISPHRQQKDDPNMFERKEWVVPSKCHVLIIDEDDHLTDTVAEGLSRKGYDVTVCESGDEGVALIKRMCAERRNKIGDRLGDFELPVEPDVLEPILVHPLRLHCIVCDVNMDSKEGPVAMWLKEQRETFEIPLVLLGDAEDLEDHEALTALEEARFLSIMYKPFLQDSFLRLVKRVVNTMRNEMANKFLLRKVMKVEIAADDKDQGNDQSIDDASIRIRNEMPFF